MRCEKRRTEWVVRLLREKEDEKGEKDRRDKLEFLKNERYKIHNNGFGSPLGYNMSDNVRRRWVGGIILIFKLIQKKKSIIMKNINLLVFVPSL